MNYVQTVVKTSVVGQYAYSSICYYGGHFGQQSGSEYSDIKQRINAQFHSETTKSFYSTKLIALA